MNNQCPSCGAIYNVASKDIGRRIKCKKCATALIVTEGGLEVDDPSAAPVAAPPRSGPAPAPASNDFADDGDEVVAPRKSAGRGARRSGGGGMSLDPLQIFKDFGGLAALLFGFGAFLVIVFLFMPIIGVAAVQRAQGGADRIDQEWKSKDRLMRKDKKTEEEITTARDKFYKDNDKDKALDNVDYERVSNKRALWMERYGMMFGFLFLMAGSLGFLMPAQPGIRRVVGAVVLTAQMVLVFIYFIIRGGIAEG